MQNILRDFSDTKAVKDSLKKNWGNYHYHLGRAPLRAARKPGYQVGILQASKMGYPVYTRLGFQDFGKLSLYLREEENLEKI